MRSLLLFLLLPLMGKAQLLDSIGLFLQEPPRLVAKLDIRGSFVSNENVRFFGAKLGLQHAGRFQYGIGYSFLMTRVEQEVVVEGLSTTARLRLGYVTPYVDYAFFSRGHWEARIPVQIGIGSGSVVYDDADGRTQRWARTGVIVYEPAMTIQYRFLKYFAVSGGWGYRLALTTHHALGEQLTAPIYILGFRAFLQDIWQDFGPDGE